MKRLLSIIAVLSILGITIYLIAQIPGPKEPAQTISVNSDIAPSTEEWLGIFLQGQRIGYSFTKITRTDTGLVVENRSQMTLNMMNRKTTLNTRLFAHTDAEYALKDFIMEIETPGHPAKIEGVVQGKKLTYTSTAFGTSTSQTITLKEKPYFPDAIEEVIRRKGLKAGDEVMIPYFDPTTQTPSKATIKVFGKEEVEVAGVTRQGIRVEIDYMNIKSVLWLDDDYRLIKEMSPGMGIVMIPLSKQDALAEIEDAFDLLSFFAVKLDQPLSRPRTLSYLKITLDNVITKDLDLSDDYQNVIDTDPVTIELHRPDLDELPKLELPITEQKEFLQPSVYIQCAESKIIEKAKEFIGDEKNAQNAVARLVKGVYNYLEKNPTASLPSAIDVLHTKEGDCNEHSVLFAALARAAGIPTKIYVGLVNLNGHAYYYHAWCAVWLGKWVPVDPTLNQFPADVAHLKLKEGEISEQAQVLQVVGQLDIDVIEFAR